MSSIRSIYYIARADFLERIRQNSLLVILFVTLLAAYIFVPPVDAGYVTLNLDGYRGIYNSAWIGSSVAISTTLLLSLLGFYLVKNCIQRDESTGVGQIIASSSMKKMYYLMGKLLSNIFVLSVITGVVVVVSPIMQWVRGEDRTFELWPLISPFLFLTLPFMAVVAALAVVFETFHFLKGTLGNVIYFFLYLLFTAGSGALAFGPQIIISAMQKDLLLIHPELPGSYGMGILFQREPLHWFEWQGVIWTFELLIQQLEIVMVSFVLIAGASAIFHGFREKGYAKRKHELAMVEITPAYNKELDSQIKYESLNSRCQAATLSPVVFKDSFWALAIAEWKLILKSASLRWLIVAAILFILPLAVSVSESSEWLVWPVIWIWPIKLWSGMGNQDVRYGTQFLVVSSRRYVIRQLMASWISGIILTCMVTGGMIIRMVFEGDLEHLLYNVAAVFLIPSLALACGVLTKGWRTFELLYLIIWYLGPLSKLPYLDFLGTHNSNGDLLMMNSVYLLISLGLLLVAYQSRKRLGQD
ncbi:Tat pathway signal protein [Paenibacillus sp. FSL P4-0338]|uniref:hypothetical protein n=1 Tax=unclassified Paenibacillus TaxID=185978 RepID=UPI0003E29392|nr:hypothetical protein [Paenibacillus sp. FSL R7-269]ETT54276.1 hypothetical protein C162_05489 [Paenibacillus sp. FSL R7-269]